MSLKKSRFIKGIILAPDNAALDGIIGEIKVDSSTGKIQVTLKEPSDPLPVAHEIITSSQTQTLTNKTLTSPVLDTGVSGSAIDIDGTLAANSDTKLASQKAVKTYVDAQIGSKDEADEIIYDNTTSGLVATNVQTAIDEVDGNVDNLVTLSGVALDSTTLGTFTGTTIPDSSTIKSAIQSLETSHESHTGASSGVHGVAGSVVGTSDSQALTNKTIDADLNTISNIENADIKVGAAIARAKLASGTANRVVVNDATGVQVDAAAITASRALVSDANGIPTHSSTTSTEIGHLSGVTSAIQTQLDGKVDESGGTLTSGSVITPARLDVKQGTKASLTTYSLTATNGQIVYATDTKEMFQVIDGLLEGIGGGEGVGGTDILFAQTFETAALTDFITQTGLSLSTSSPLHGEISALLTHQAGTSPTNDQSFKQVIAVDNKFRNQTMVLRLDVKSNASAGNVVINIYDETNAANIVASEQLQLSNDVNGTKNSVGFTIPETCASLSYTITALPEAGSPVTRIDDIICELAETALLETVVELTGNAQTLTIPLTQSGLITQPDENYQLNGFTYRTASTNTNILFFNDGTIANNNLSTISINNDSVLGSTFTIQRDGFYSFNFQAELGGTAGDVYLVKNSTTAVSANILSGFYENGAQFINSFAWSGPLKQGDVIRIIRSGVVATFTADARNYLSISYVGNVKQVSVNPNSKITIPTSELRFEGASARGTSPGNTIVKFDTIAKIRGDAFTVNNDPVLGTSIVMKKAGRLSINGVVFGSAVDNALYLTKNQAVLTAAPTLASEILSTGYNVSVRSMAQVNWQGDVNVGDVFRLATPNLITASTSNMLNLSFQEQDISVSVTNTLPQFSESDSCVRVTGGNGFTGQTRLFSNVIQNIGSDVQYTAASGQFRAMSSGIYNITYQEETAVSTNGPEIYIYVNETLTAIANDRINTAASLTRYPLASIQLYLSEGDIITGRVIATATFPSVSSYSSMTISKVGKPNVTGVDVTPFVNVPQPDSEFINKGGAGVGSTNTSIVTFNTTTFKNTLGSKGILSYSNSGTLGDSFTALKRCTVRVNFNCSTLTLSNAGYEARLLKNDITGAPSSTLTVSSGSVGSGAGPEIDQVSLQGSYQLEAGDVLRFFVLSSAVFNLSGTAFMSIEAEALSDQILTAPETFSTDTTSLTYAGSGTYTLSTLANAPVGTFITFTYAANTNTRTQTLNTAPNQLTADMNANGILLYTRAFNATSSAGQPAAIAIQIGKGLKGKTLDLYKSAGKVTAGGLDYYNVSTSESKGAQFKDYNENTGILLVDAGITDGSGITQSRFNFSDSSAQTSGYLVINASKNPALTGLNVLLPRIATLSDVKASGTEGGTATSGAYQTRILNTISDPTGIVTSLTSNQFILPAGEYYIEASAPTRAVNNNKIKIRNITDSTDAIIGSNAFAGTNGSSSVALGNIVITSSKTFELQHRVQTTAATNGFGSAAAFGENEVYSIVKITKVK